MIEHIQGNLYRMSIPLPGSALKTLNSYVMKSASRNLIVDTGFNQPECLEAMLAGIKELGLDMSNTDILSTHLHADHNGLISQIISDTSVVYMSGPDRETFIKYMTDGDAVWGALEDKFREEGYPEEELDRTREANPARKFVSSKLFDITPIEDGDVLCYGDMCWLVVVTPGHTAGHVCLYERNHKILITGDHLLFDITPNITWWREMRNSLESYLDSLDKVAQLEVEVALTAHRNNDGSFYSRIKELKQHHADRLNDILEIVRETPNISGYGIASKMKWSIRVSSWAEFPAGQRWFAVGEAIAHINYLVLAGKLLRNNTQGFNTYTLA